MWGLSGALKYPLHTVGSNNVFWWYPSAMGSMSSPGHHQNQKHGIGRNLVGWTSNFMTDRRVEMVVGAGRGRDGGNDGAPPRSAVPPIHFAIPNIPITVAQDGKPRRPLSGGVRALRDGETSCGYSGSPEVEGNEVADRMNSMATANLGSFSHGQGWPTSRGGQPKPKREQRRSGSRKGQRGADLTFHRKGQGSARE